jgi:hypothetical protein
MFTLELKRRKRSGIRARGSSMRKKNVIEYTLNSKKWKKRVKIWQALGSRDLLLKL